MKVYYDFHIHSCLSPCGDEDMTPNNIVNMSLIKGLNVIALTDHNTMKNCPAALKVAEKAGLLVIPGIEIQTREDVHMITLFPDLEAAETMEKLLDEHRLPLPHKPEKFGHQMILNDQDELVEEYKITLMGAVDIGVDEVIKRVHALGGVVFPAHINKQANSVISNLGFMPPDWEVGAVEVFKAKENGELVTQYEKNYHVLINSDAHYIMDISEAENYIELEVLSIEEIFKYLSKC